MSAELILQEYCSLAGEAAHVTQPEQGQAQAARIALARPDVRAPSWLTPKYWSSEFCIRKSSALMPAVRDALSHLGHMLAKCYPAYARRCGDARGDAAM